MTIDEFLFVFPRSTSHQGAVDALIAILDAALAKCEKPDPVEGNLSD